MSGPPLQRVTAGRPLRIPASDYNAFCAATEQVQAWQIAVGGSPQKDSSSATHILVANKSGQDLKQGEVVTFSDALVGAEPESSLRVMKSRIVLNANTPQSESEPWGITAEPIRDQKFGLVVVAGMVPAKLNELAEPGDSVGPEADEWQRLLVGGNGGTVVWCSPVETDGIYWAYILIGGGGSGAFVMQVDTDTNGDFDIIYGGREFRAKKARIDGPTVVSFGEPLPVQGHVLKSVVVTGDVIAATSTPSGLVATSEGMHIFRAKVVDPAAPETIGNGQLFVQGQFQLSPLVPLATPFPVDNGDEVWVIYEHPSELFRVFHQTCGTPS